MCDREDAAIVADCLGGNAQDFVVLVERYQRVIYNLALRMLGDPEDAQDATQTAFLRVWESLERFDPRHRFFSWVYRITTNECLNKLHRRRRLEPLPPGLPSGDDPTAGVRRRETSARVQEALLGLSPEHREVVILRHFMELSYGEIAETLALPQKTVKSRLYEARQRLCEILPRSAV
jgi:RNA polymerase sigma-70 factor, ECF subfamily